MINLNNFEHSPALAELTVSYRRERHSDHHLTDKRSVLTNTDECEQYLRSIWNKDTFELRQEFVLLCLSSSFEVLGWVKLHTGFIDFVTFDPRLVLAVALQTVSSSIVIAHNRPSGKAEPEPRAMLFTKRLAQASILLAIPLLDHMILGRDDCYSYAKAGELDNW